MVELETARHIAQDALTVVETDRPLELLGGTEDRPRHWVFRYNDARYIAGGDPRFDYLAGGPIAIAKSDGAVIWLNSWASPEEQIAALRQGRVDTDLGFDELLARASSVLEHLQKNIAQPITFRHIDGRQQIIESPHLVVYPWNSVEYYETEDPFVMLLSGPIALPRNGDEPFVMGTARPYNDYIEQYNRGEWGNGIRVQI